MGNIMEGRCDYFREVKKPNKRKVADRKCFILGDGISYFSNGLPHNGKNKNDELERPEKNVAKEYLKGPY